MSENKEITKVKNEITARVTMEDKKKLFNAITSADNKMSDFINKTIDITGILFTTGQVTDDDGVTRDSERAIVFDKDGVTYHTMSTGILNSLHSLVTVFGEPDKWAEPITVTVVRKEIKNGQTFLLEIV